MKKLIITIDKLSNENFEDITLPKDMHLYIVAGENANVPLKLLMLLKNLGDHITMLEADTEVSFAFQLGLMCCADEGKTEISYIGSLELPDNLPIPSKVTFTKYPDLKSFLKPVKKQTDKEKTVRTRKTAVKEEPVQKSPRIVKESVTNTDMPKQRRAVKEAPAPQNILANASDTLISPAFKKKVSSLIPAATQDEIEKIAVAFTKSNADVVLDLQMRFVLGTEKGNEYAEILRPHFDKLKKIIF